MDAQAKHRNIDLLRNVLVDELIEGAAAVYRDAGDLEQAVVIATDHENPINRAARRLQITMPKRRKLGALVVERTLGS